MKGWQGILKQCTGNKLDSNTTNSNRPPQTLWKQQPKKTSPMLDQSKQCNTLKIRLNMTQYPPPLCEVKNKNLRNRENRVNAMVWRRAEAVTEILRKHLINSYCTSQPFPYTFEQRFPLSLFKHVKNVNAQLTWATTQLMKTRMRNKTLHFYVYTKDTRDKGIKCKPRSRPILRPSSNTKKSDLHALSPINLRFMEDKLYLPHSCT